MTTCSPTDASPGATPLGSNIPRPSSMVWVVTAHATIASPAWQSRCRCRCPHLPRSSPAARKRRAKRDGTAARRRAAARPAARPRVSPLSARQMAGHRPAIRAPSRRRWAWRPRCSAQWQGSRRGIRDRRADAPEDLLIARGAPVSVARVAQGIARPRRPPMAGQIPTKSALAAGKGVESKGFQPSARPGTSRANHWSQEGFKCSQQYDVRFY
jgi:hypothetical protein